jgi:hypothetical protein
MKLLLKCSAEVEGKYLRNKLNKIPVRCTHSKKHIQQKLVLGKKPCTEKHHCMSSFSPISCIPVGIEK